MEAEKMERLARSFSRIFLWIRNCIFSRRCVWVKQVTSERKTITKLEVASHQLDVAIRLFMDGDYLSSLTLAGAAEEILGRLCERAGKPMATESIINFHWKDTDATKSDKERRKILLDVLNDARNQAKHANNPDEKDFSSEQVFPLQMIMRAMPMARMLGAKFANEAVMVRWIREHPEATK